MLIDDINQPQEIKDHLNYLLKKPVGFVVFAGKNGTGKTFAVKTAFENFQDESKFFITQTDMNLYWMQQVQDWGNAIPFLQSLVNYKLLIIDDLGTRIPTPAFMDFLYAIADKRYEKKDKKTTIITTNLNSKDMRLQFGDAFVSRIASGKCFRLEGTDRRFNEF